jgi:hypothetical protein
LQCIKTSRCSIDLKAWFYVGSVRWACEVLNWCFARLLADG